VMACAESVLFAAPTPFVYRTACRVGAVLQGEGAWTL
jgi:hypothetical protein